MSWPAIVVLCVGWGLGALVVGCRIATLCAWWFHDSAAAKSKWGVGPTPDGEQWFVAALLGLGAAIVWPPVVAAVVMRGLLFRPPDRVLAQRRAARIRELEAELRGER